VSPETKRNDPEPTDAADRAAYWTTGMCKRYYVPTSVRTKLPLQGQCLHKLTALTVGFVRTITIVYVLASSTSS
jgi:hypothetical protein